MSTSGGVMTLMIVSWNPSRLIVPAVQTVPSTTTSTGSTSERSVRKEK